MTTLFDFKDNYHKNLENSSKFTVPTHFLQYILEEIFWSGTPLLESVGEHEPHVEELRENIKRAIRKAVIPMKAYAREYEKHLEIMNMDINAYVK